MFNRYRIVFRAKDIYPYMVQYKFLFWWVDIWSIGERDLVSARKRLNKAREKVFVVEYIHG